MQIKRLEMTNWRPFYGTHILDVNSSHDRPYVWIHGDNMRGKTSVLNAVRWCLYGRTEDSGRERGAHLNLNKRAIAESDNQMSVKLVFDHQGQGYVLERHAQWPDTPTSDRRKEERADLRVAGRIVPGDEVPKRISNILHEDISQFYLFDGETIREFEDKLASGQGADFVRRAIERIVGLPAIRRGSVDLRDLADEAEHQVTKLLRLEQRHEKLSEELERIATGLRQAQEDHSKLMESHEALEARKKDLEDELRRLEGVRRRIRERDTLDDQRTRSEEKRNELTEAIRSDLSTHWWFPALPKIMAVQNELERKRDEVIQREADALSLKGRIEALQHSISSDTCALCGQQVNAEHRHRVQGEIDDALGRLEDINKARGEENDAMFSSLRRAFRGANPELLIDRSKRVASLDVEIFALKTQIEDIDEEIREGEAENAAKIQRDLDQTKAQIVDVERLAGDAEKTVRALKSQQKEKRDKIPVTPGGDRFKRKLDILSEMAAAFGEAVDRFREAVRSSVEEEARALFERLTTEPEFQGVAISPSYEVKILDSENRPVAPSAAAQQVSALALIGGLYRASVREGPLIIDTPLARFDIGHRDRILENLKDVGDQVILLLQPGEFHRDRYMERVGNRVASEYTIERVSDQESRLIPKYDAKALIV